MKKLCLILAFVAIFAACKKENNTKPALGSGLMTVTTQNFTLNIKYVKDCSMRAVATGTEILLGNTVLKTDSTGNYIYRYQKTVAIGQQSTENGGFIVEGMPRGFGVDNWTTNESILFVQNDSLNVDVQFAYNVNTAAQLKDSLAIGYDNIFKPLPKLTRDSSFKMSVISRNRLYRKDNDGKYTPFQTVQLGVKGPNGYNYLTPTLRNPAAGPCGRDFILIQ